MDVNFCETLGVIMLKLTMVCEICSVFSIAVKVLQIKQEVKITFFLNTWMLKS